MRFDPVICGVDASQESLDAARQAARIVEPDGRLILVAVAELEVAAQAGFAASMVVNELEQEAQEALDQAEAAVGETVKPETRLVTGPIASTLLAEVERERASLLVLGTHGHGRATGILLARASTSMLHDAPCAVLIARTPANDPAFPATIAVGLDGSPASKAAEAAARALADRFGSSVRRLVATGGKQLDLDALQVEHADLEISDAKPKEALLAVAQSVDLLVVGRRGVHGLKSLGSVSERVAHEAACSVLVVRGG
jgi:nucleotide-binding universal stress UspA family protein